MTSICYIWMTIAHQAFLLDGVQKPLRIVLFDFSTWMIQLGTPSSDPGRSLPYQSKMFGENIIIVQYNFGSFLNYLQFHHYSIQLLTSLVTTAAVVMNRGDVLFCKSELKFRLTMRISATNISRREVVRALNNGNYNLFLQQFLMILLQCVSSTIHMALKKVAICVQKKAKK